MRLRQAAWILGLILGAPLSAQDTGGPAASSPMDGGACGGAEGDSADALWGAAERLEHLRTRTAFSVDRGELEIDLVLSHLDEPESPVTEVRGEVTFGALERFQIEVELARRRRHGTDVGSDENRLELESKWTLSQTRQQALAVAAELELVVPGGAVHGTASSWGAGLFLVASRPWFRLHARGHVEIGVETEAVREFETLVLNAAVERPIRGKLVAQVGWNSSFDGRGARGALVPGLEWRARAAEGPTAAVGFPIGLTRGAERWGLILHVEVEL